MNGRDPLRELQAAARAAAEHVAPGERANRVIVLGAGGARLLDTTVPACACGPTESEVTAAASTAEPVAGWVVSERTAVFDGNTVAVAPSRLKLLRVLVDAEGPLSGKELAKLAFDRDSDEENARYHVKALRGELARAFPDFEGEIVPGDGGYRLVLR